MSRRLTARGCLPLVLLSAAAAAPPSAPLVPLDLFVASKCPDAARCETAFLPDVLRQVRTLEGRVLWLSVQLCVIRLALVVLFLR